MINNFLLAISSAFFATFFSGILSIYLKNMDFNRKILEKRYYKAYFPFFTAFIRGNVSEAFNNYNLDYKAKTKILNDLNKFICNNICYLEPNSQSELYFLMEIGLKAEVFSKFNVDIKFYSTNNTLNLLKNFYNTLLYEYKNICIELNYPIPKIEDFILKITPLNEETNNTN